MGWRWATAAQQALYGGHKLRSLQGVRARLGMAIVDWGAR